MYEYQQIIYRLRSGQSQRDIARMGLASRDKLREIVEEANSHSWLEPDNPMPGADAVNEVFAKHVSSRGQPLKLKPYLSLISPWIEEGLGAKVIYQHLIVSCQFQGSYNCVQRYIKQIRAGLPKNLTVPLNFSAGEAAQLDFGYGPLLLDERTGKIVKTWFFVMTLCFSRHQYVELVTNQEVETWLSCHQHAFEWFGGVVKKVIIDNPKCAIITASTTNPEVQRSYESFAQEYGFIISACPPADPQKKGRVESGVKYVKGNFMPLRDLKSLQDGNKQLKKWALETAGNRIHGTTRKRPLDSFVESEKEFLKPLPVTAIDISTWHKVKLYRDCHVRFKYCRYSAPYQYANQELWLKASNTTVSIYLDHQLLTTHSRAFDPDKPMTKLEHLPPNAKAFFEQDEAWCKEQAMAIGCYCMEVIEILLTDPVRELLRGAQSVIRLANQYSKKRLENACQRSLLFNAVSAPTIKKILQKGLDYQALPVEQSFDHLGQAYQGYATYQRTTSKIKH